MGQQDALRIITAANSSFSPALWKSYETKGLELKVADRSELYFDHTGRRNKGKEPAIFYPSQKELQI